MISISPTSANLAAAAPCAAGDPLLDIGWLTVARPAVFDRLEARLAEMEDAGDWAAGRQTYTVCTKDWHYLDDKLGPVIAHRPTVTLFDKMPCEPAATRPGRSKGAPPKDGWLRFASDKERAEEAASIDAWMRFACRIDIDDEPKAPAKSNGAEIPEHVLAKIEAPKKARARVAERLREFTHDGGSVAGRRYEPFTASYVRSDGKKTAMRSKLEIKCLELYNARLPKDALYGHDKGAVFRPSDTGIAPIFLRDAPYLTIGWWTVRGQLAVDLDTVWPDLETLRAALIKALGPKLFPNIIVYRLNAKGEIENPHLIWILPPGAEVGVRGNSRGGPIRMFNMVQRALVSALIHLGADAGHLNSGKTKNPLSEFWSIACSDEHFCDLGDFVAGLPTVSTNEKEMRRRQAAFRGVAVEDLSDSKRDWNMVTDAFRAEYATGFRSKSDAFKQARESEHAFIAWAEAHVSPRVLASPGGDTDNVRRILKRQIEWRSRHRPSRLTRQYDGDNRGRDRGLYKDLGLTGAELPEAREKQGIERQRLAGKQTRAAQHKVTLSKVVQAIDDHLGAGLPDTRTDAVRSVIQSKIVGRSVAYAYIDEALAIVRDASRYIASPLPETNTIPVPAPEPEVTHPSKSPHPVVRTVLKPAWPVSGERITVKVATPRRNPAPGGLKLRDLPDDPIFEAVEIMRACAADVGAGRVHLWTHAESGQPVSRTVH